MTIIFQNPTKGPLITVQFELDETLLGLVAAAERVLPQSGVETLRAIANGTRVPAVLTSGSGSMLGRAMAIAGKFAPYLAVLSCAGDSRPRIVAQDDAPHSVPSQAMPALGSVSDDVALAGEITRVTAADQVVPQGWEAQFLAQLRRILNDSLVLSELQKERLDNLIELARDGYVPFLDIVRELGKYMEADFISRLRKEGLDVQEVTRGGQVYLQIAGQDPQDAYGAFHPLLMLLSTVDSSQPGATWFELKHDRRTGHYKLTFPTWETWLKLMSPYLDSVVWMARLPSPDEINRLHAQGKAPVTLLPEGTIDFPGLRVRLHGLPFAVHDLLHVLIVKHLSPEVLRLVTTLHDLLKDAAQTERTEATFQSVLDKLADANFCNMSINMVLSLLNIYFLTVSGFWGMDFDLSRAIDRTLQRVRDALRAHPIPGVSPQTHQEVDQLLR